MKTAKDLKKEILEQEVPEVPVDPLIEIRERVDKTLKEKVGILVKSFQDEREKGFAELASLNQSLESLKNDRGKLVAEKESLVCGIMGYGTVGVGDLDRRISWLSKQIKSLEDQIGQLFSRLTTIPKFDFSFLNFLTKGGRDGAD